MTIEASSPPPTESTSIDADILETLGLGDGDTSTPAPVSEDGTASAPAEPGAAVGSAPAAPDATPAEPAPTTPPAPPPAAPAQPEGTPPAPAASAPAEPPAPALQVDEAALRTASLTAQLDAANRALAELRANPQGTPAPAGTTPAAPSSEAPAEPPPFKYSLTLPEATKAALLSEDPQQNIAAINSIVNDLGTIVHNTVLTQVRSEVRGAFSSLIGMANASTANQTQEQSREAARESYFTAFPDHKNALIEPIIRQQAVELSAEHPGLPFDQQYINALGARVNAAIDQLRTPAGGEPAAAPANPTPARPAAHLPSGVRPSGATPTTGGDLGEDIMGTLDPFSG